MSKFDNFDKTRMFIFQELVKKFWNNEDHTDFDLASLAYEIQKQLDFDDNDIPFIKNHIRLCLGLDVNNNPDDNLVIPNDYHNRVSLPIVEKIGHSCETCSKQLECESICKYDSYLYQDLDNVPMSQKCTTCGDCVRHCDLGGVADKIEFVPIIDILKNRKEGEKVFATIAPAIAGQFTDGVTFGKLRTAVKSLGFDDLIEVALFADMLTVKEAFEFNHLIQGEDDYFLTSCCCPVWFNLTKKKYPHLYSHMSPTISPMIASGKVLKRLYPDSKVVFISPCVAKKAEAKEEGYEGIIDYVLNFQELQQVFDALDINVAELEEENKDQASLGGRLYAKSGGVTFSVKTIVNRLSPERVVKFKPVKFAGAMECKNALDKLANGENIGGNFIEGMGCSGGCVGGPKTLVDKDTATLRLNEFAESSVIMTPFDNYNLLKVVNQLGFDSIEDIASDSELTDFLTREQ